MRAEIVSSEDILSAFDTLFSNLMGMANSSYLTGAGIQSMIKSINPNVYNAFLKQVWLGSSPAGTGGQVLPSEFAIFIQRYINDRIEHGDSRDFQGYYAQKLIPTTLALFQASADLQKPLVFSKLQSNTLTAKLIDPMEVTFSVSGLFPSLPSGVTLSDSITQPSFTWNNTLTFTNTSTTASAYVTGGIFQKYITLDTTLGNNQIFSDYGAGNFSQPIFQSQAAFILNGVFDATGAVSGVFFQNTTSQNIIVEKPMYDQTYLANGKVFRNFDPQLSLYIGKNAKGYVGIQVPFSETIEKSGSYTIDLDVRADGLFIATDEVYSALTNQV